MFYRDEMWILHSKFVIGSIPGDVVQISIGKRCMEEVKCAVSSVE